MTKEVPGKELMYVIGLIVGILVIIALFFVMTTKSPEYSSPIENPAIEIEEVPLEYEEVLQQGDVSACAGIELDAKREACEAKLEVCTEDSCFYQKALNSRFAPDCQNIQNSTLRAQCSSEIFRTDIFERAVLEDSISICEEIQDSQMLQRCKDNYYFVSSINKNDVAYCDMIIQEDLKNECITN
ncbi:MAG: hypothetical protein VX028_01290 [Nanoarchaeota archaeon]|nr:hypothetical protein [Nanoarchaeota archaeon]